MSNILETLAGNKTVANLAFKQIKKYISDNNVSFIAIYVDNSGDIGAKQYTEPMAIIKKSEYDSMIAELNEFKQNILL